MGLKPLSAVPVIKRLNGRELYRSRLGAVHFGHNDQSGDAPRPVRDTDAGVSIGTARFHDGDDRREATRMEGCGVRVLLSPGTEHAADTLDDGFGYNYCFEKAAQGTATLDSRIFTPTTYAAGACADLAGRSCSGTAADGEAHVGFFPLRHELSDPGFTEAGRSLIR